MNKIKVAQIIDYKNLSYEDSLKFPNSEELDIEKINQLTIFYLKGTKTRHRKVYPAVLSPIGFSWWKNGQIHRLNAPAFVYKTGNNGYYEYGNFVRDSEGNK